MKAHVEMANAWERSQGEIRRATPTFEGRAPFSGHCVRSLTEAIGTEFVWAWVKALVGVRFAAPFEGALAPPLPQQTHLGHTK